MIRSVLALTIAAALIAGPAPAQTIVIVRHGEKVAPTGDIDLSPAGQARAEALALALKDAEVTRVIATTLKRTQQTARPAALAAGVGIEAVGFQDGDAQHIKQIAGRARLADPSATVLIVGHSNTIAEIARALGDPTPPAITDCDYDRMTVIQLDPHAAPKALHTRYGAPTESC